MSRHRRSQPDRYDKNSVTDSTGSPPSAARCRAGHPADPVGVGFPADEWALLRHLPAQVVIAAMTPGPGPARRTVVEGLAGIEAIAGGRAFDSDLVRAVVAAIFAEPDQPVVGPGGFGGDASGQRGRAAEVLANCRAATVVLAARADPADSASYRQWVQSIAVRVCAAARSGDDPVGAAPVDGPDRRDAAGQRLVADLAVALSLG